MVLFKKLLKCSFCSHELTEYIPVEIFGRQGPQQWMQLVAQHVHAVQSLNPHQARSQFLGILFSNTLILIWPFCNQVLPWLKARFVELCLCVLQVWCVHFPCLDRPSFTSKAAATVPSLHRASSLSIRTDCTSCTKTLMCVSQTHRLLTVMQGFYRS